MIVTFTLNVSAGFYIVIKKRHEWKILLPELFTAIGNDLVDTPRNVHLIINGCQWIRLANIFLVLDLKTTSNKWYAHSWYMFDSCLTEKDKIHWKKFKFYHFCGKEINVGVSAKHFHITLIYRWSPAKEDTLG